MIKRTAWLIITSILFAVLLSGCISDTTTPAPINNQDENDSVPDDQIQLPDSREETIFIEGMEETITTYYYGGETFATYVPADLLIESEEDTHWFYANFVGQKNEAVYLQLHFYPEEITSAPDLTAADSLLTANGLEGEMLQTDEFHHDWTIGEYKIKDGGYAYLSEHENRYFVFVLKYPVEFEEGFGPRANKIIENFYWRDTNTGLN